MIDIDVYEPDFVISCKFLNSSKEIYEIMRSKTITRAYVYAMVYQPKTLYADILKVGMSSPSLSEKRERQVGERIVRQVSHVPGWDSGPPYSSHGSDFYYAVRNFLIPKKLVVENFNKDMLHIGVWDITQRAHYNIIETNDDDFTLATWAEGELAKQYKQTHGNKLPLLNKVDPTKTKVYNKPFLSKENFNEVFVIPNDTKL
jgi:hypothetical protein